MDAYNFWELRFRIFRLFKTSVCLHITMILYLLFILLISNESILWRVVLAVLIFASVLLHEYGHVFAARYCNGYSDVIVLWPLGGFAEVNLPHTQKAYLLTAIGGPLVNLIIAIGTGLAYYVCGYNMSPTTNFLLHYVFLANVFMLGFNLLPVYPMDGGRILQALLWKKFGFHRSVSISAVIAMIMIGGYFIYMILDPFKNFSYSLMFVFLLVWLFINAYQSYKYHLTQQYNNEFTVTPEYPDAQTDNRNTQNEVKPFINDDVDAILDKISAHGMHSLSNEEKRILTEASKKLAR